jgi:hypothetical protein
VLVALTLNGTPDRRARRALEHDAWRALRDAPRRARKTTQRTC